MARFDSAGILQSHVRWKTSLLRAKLEMSAPKKIKLTKQTTLNSFLTTRQDENTDDTLQAVNTDDQDSLLAEDCDNETTSLSEKPRDEIITPMILNEYCV